MKKQTCLRIIITISIYIVFLISCKGSDSVTWSESEDRYVSTDTSQLYDVLIVENGQDSFDMFAEVKDDPKDLYVGVFNTSFTGIDAPSVETREFSSGQSSPLPFYPGGEGITREGLT